VVEFNKRLPPPGETVTVILAWNPARSVLTSSLMKPKSVIITDPKKLFAICSNQPRVSREQMRKSVLAGIHSSRSSQPAKVN